MEKLNVSYYISEKLASKIDERSCLRSGNRSQQVTDDLNRFYDMLDAGLRAALDALTGDEIRMVIAAIKAHPVSSQNIGSDIKRSLTDIIGAPSIAAKIDTLDDIACFALLDWARSSR